MKLILDLHDLDQETQRMLRLEAIRKEIPICQVMKEAILEKARRLANAHRASARVERASI